MKLARWQNCARRVENCGSRPLVNRSWFQPNPLQAPSSHLPVAEGLRISPSSPGPAHHGGYTPLLPHSSPNPGHSPPYTSLTSPLPTSHLCPGPSTITAAQNNSARASHPGGLLTVADPVSTLQPGGTCHFSAILRLCLGNGAPHQACLLQGRLGGPGPSPGSAHRSRGICCSLGWKAPGPPHCLTS